SSHLRMNELVFASILLTADEVTSTRFSGHITLGYSVKLKHHTLYFPGNWLESILARPAESCCKVVFPISLSERLAVYCLPRLRMGWSAMREMFSPPIIKVTLSFSTPFRKERLLDFFALNFILAQVINSSSLFMSLDVHGAVWSKHVMSSM